MLSTSKYQMFRGVEIRVQIISETKTQKKGMNNLRKKGKV